MRMYGVEGGACALRNVTGIRRFEVLGGVLRMYVGRGRKRSYNTALRPPPPKCIISQRLCTRHLSVVN
jgi:hypothetical protein